MYVLSQSLQFLLSVPTPQIPIYYKQLSELIANTDNTVNDVFDWVEVSGVIVHSCHVTLPPPPPLRNLALWEIPRALTLCMH